MCRELSWRNIIQSSVIKEYWNQLKMSSSAFGMCVKEQKRKKANDRTLVVFVAGSLPGLPSLIYVHVYAMLFPQTMNVSHIIVGCIEKKVRLSKYMNCTFCQSQAYFLYQPVYIVYILDCIAAYCIMFQCIVLHCIVLLYCITLHCIALHCSVLHGIVLYCIAFLYFVFFVRYGTVCYGMAWYGIALYCIIFTVLHFIALHCIALHCTQLYFVVLQNSC